MVAFCFISKSLLYIYICIINLCAQKNNFLCTIALQVIDYLQLAVFFIGTKCGLSEIITENAIFLLTLAILPLQLPLGPEFLSVVLEMAQLDLLYQQ